MMHLTYQQRSEHCQQPLAKSLLRLMAEKQTNLALAADVTDQAALLHLAEELGPEICILKTHIDILQDFDRDLPARLQAVARKHHFLLFEDRKFADIGNTVHYQYQGGMYRIASWADIINAHPLPGPEIITGLKQATSEPARGLLLLAEMSSHGNLIDEHYTQASLAMAQQHSDFVIGFIAQRRLSDDPRFLYLTPGVHIQETGDTLGQSYNHPREVVIQRGSDIVIVGRGIYQANNPLQTAQQYRQIAWQAYLERCGISSN